MLCFQPLQCYRNRSLAPIDVGHDAREVLAYLLYDYGEENKKKDIIIIIEV